MVSPASSSLGTPAPALGEDGFTCGGTMSRTRRPGAAPRNGLGWICTGKVRVSMTTAPVEPQATAPASVRSAGGTDRSRRSRGETSGRTGSTSTEAATGASATGPSAWSATNPGGGPEPAAHAAKQQATKAKVERSDHAHRVVCIKQSFGRPRLAGTERATVVTANANLGEVRFGIRAREVCERLGDCWQAEDCGRIKQPAKIA